MTTAERALLLDRIGALEQDHRDLFDRAEKSVMEAMAERDEAREAVKRLAYAVDALLSGERGCDVIAVGILNDDVVKRIVEGE